MEDTIKFELTGNFQYDAGVYGLIRIMREGSIDSEINNDSLIIKARDVERLLQAWLRNIFRSSEFLPKRQAIWFPVVEKELKERFEAFKQEVELLFDQSNCFSKEFETGYKELIKKYFGEKEKNKIITLYEGKIKKGKINKRTLNSIQDYFSRLTAADIPYAQKPADKKEKKKFEENLGRRFEDCRFVKSFYGFWNLNRFNWSTDYSMWGHKRKDDNKKSKKHKLGNDCINFKEEIRSYLIDNKPHTTSQEKNRDEERYLCDFCLTGNTKVSLDRTRVFNAPAKDSSLFYFAEESKKSLHICKSCEFLLLFMPFGFTQGNQNWNEYNFIHSFDIDEMIKLNDKMQMVSGQIDDLLALYLDDLSLSAMKANLIMENISIISIFKKKNKNFDITVQSIPKHIAVFLSRNINHIRAIRDDTIKREIMRSILEGIVDLQGLINDILLSVLRAVDGKKAKYKLSFLPQELINLNFNLKKYYKTLIKEGSGMDDRNLWGWKRFGEKLSSKMGYSSEATMKKKRGVKSILDCIRADDIDKFWYIVLGLATRYEVNPPICKGSFEIGDAGNCLCSALLRFKTGD